jgi:hypothetical protein
MNLSRKKHKMIQVTINSKRNFLMQEKLNFKKGNH